MKVVVTGGAGFIGANLCRHLATLPEITSVVAYDDLSTGAAENLRGVEAQLVVGSILDAHLLAQSVDQAAAIVHLAALPSVPRSIADPLTTLNVNAHGTVSVLQAARALNDPLVIVASSSSVYGANPEMPKHEALAPQPMSPYAASKLAAEQYALAWQFSYGVRTLVFRFFNVFGPLQSAGHAYAAVVPTFVSSAIAGEGLTIHGDGRQSRDFTYVGTVCETISTAVTRGISSTMPVNLAFGSRVTLLEVVTLLEQLLDRTLEVAHVESRAGDVRHSQADNRRLLDLLPGVEPVSLRTGLAQTIAWFQAG